MTWNYSEDKLVEQTAIDLFYHRLGWVSGNAIGIQRVDG